MTSARTAGSSSVVSHTDAAAAAAAESRQQLITELLMQHRCCPSCTSANKVFYILHFTFMQTNYASE